MEMRVTVMPHLVDPNPPMPPPLLGRLITNDSDKNSYLVLGFAAAVATMICCEARLTWAALPT